MKTKEEKQLRGTYRSDRDKKGVASISKNKRKLKTAPPGWLNKLAKQRYREYIKHLNTLLNPSDLFALAMAAKYAAEFEECESMLQAEGLMRLDKNRALRVHPATRLQRFAGEAYMKIATKYGLTPLDRSNLKIGNDTDPPPDPMDGLL